MTTLLRHAPLLTATFFLGCANVIGTSDYEPCEQDSCPAGGAGGGGAQGGSGGSGSTCHDVEMLVSGSVKVRIESPDIDFDSESTDPICLPAGTIVASAECDQGGGEDPPVAVSWGNDLCNEVSATCQFTLADDEKFFVAAASCP